MNVAIVASECFPFAKLGGLGDVVGALPSHLERLGVDVRVFIPKYSSINDTMFGLQRRRSIGEMKVRTAGVPRSVHVYSAVIPYSTVEVFFIDCYDYFHRENIYTEDDDEDERFILFNKAVIETLQRLKWVPDIVHCNDWQTGLMPLLMKDNYGWDALFSRTRFVFSIHNIVYQGRFPETTLAKGELNRALYYPGGPLEFENTVSMMKAGLVFAEAVTTVSETYAQEILTPEFGAGLEGVLQTRQADLYGILNGIDTHEWNPATDPLIPFHYTRDDPGNKEKNKEALVQSSSMTYRKDVPLIGIVSRLVRQKGFDLLAKALEGLLREDIQWIILGTGEKEIESLLTGLSAAAADRCRVHIGFDHTLAHRIEAGADLFLMPSRYEPCGLNQMYSLRYGTVPIVRRTGGLADTVRDWHASCREGEENGTGFTFDEATAEALSSTVKRAVETYHHKDQWKKIRQNGMAMDNSWDVSAKKYKDVYEKALQHFRPPHG